MVPVVERMGVTFVQERGGGRLVEDGRKVGYWLLCHCGIDIMELCSGRGRDGRAERGCIFGSPREMLVPFGTEGTVVWWLSVGGVGCLRSISVFSTAAARIFFISSASCAATAASKSSVNSFVTRASSSARISPSLSSHFFFMSSGMLPKAGTSSPSSAVVRPRLVAVVSSSKRLALAGEEVGCSETGKVLTVGALVGFFTANQLLFWLCFERERTYGAATPFDSTRSRVREYKTRHGSRNVCEWEIEIVARDISDRIESREAESGSRARKQWSQ